MSKVTTNILSIHTEKSYRMVGMIQKSTIIRLNITRKYFTTFEWTATLTKKVLYFKNSISLIFTDKYYVILF